MGALYLGILALLPNIFAMVVQMPFYVSGTGLLIVVGVALELASQIESYLIEHRYEGFFLLADDKRQERTLSIAKNIFIFMGPPGSGKGSLSNLCVQNYTGCSFQRAIYAGSILQSLHPSVKK